MIDARNIHAVSPVSHAWTHAPTSTCAGSDSEQGRGTHSTASRMARTRFGNPLIRTALLLTLAITVKGVDGVPLWALTGIAAVETRSYWQDGRLVYIDRRDGAAGERGPFQVTWNAFKMVARQGESFGRLRYDMEFAIDITCRYLLWLRQRCSSWERAVAAYNAGMSGDGWSYERQVEKLASWR